MNKYNLIQKIYTIIFKKHSMCFHIILTFFTFGIYAILYFIIKLSNKYNNNEKRKLINDIDHGTIISLQREEKFRKSIKRPLVKVTLHGGACPICQKWEGKILIDDLFSNGKPDDKHKLLSEAIKNGLFHNGCKHGLTTYYPELEGIENETEEEYQADIDYINNKISKLLK